MVRRFTVSAAAMKELEEIAVEMAELLEPDTSSVDLLQEMRTYGNDLDSPEELSDDDAPSMNHLLNLLEETQKSAMEIDEEEEDDEEDEDMEKKDEEEEDEEEEDEEIGGDEEDEDENMEKENERPSSALKNFFQNFCTELEEEEMLPPTPSPSPPQNEFHLVEQQPAAAIEPEDEKQPTWWLLSEDVQPPEEQQQHEPMEIGLVKAYQPDVQNITPPSSPQHDARQHKLPVLPPPTQPVVNPWLTYEALLPVSSQPASSEDLPPLPPELLPPPLPSYELLPPPLPPCELSSPPPPPSELPLPTCELLLPPPPSFCDDELLPSPPAQPVVGSTLSCRTLPPLPSAEDLFGDEFLNIIIDYIEEQQQQQQDPPQQQQQEPQQQRPKWGEWPKYPWVRKLTQPAPIPSGTLRRPIEN